MTKLYRISGELICDEPSLTLKEAVEKHKKGLAYADLRFTDLSGVDLSCAIAMGADFSCSNLCDADLHNATMIGAKLFYADFTKANLTFTNFNLAYLAFAKIDSCKNNFRGAIMSADDLNGEDLIKLKEEFEAIKNSKQFIREKAEEAVIDFEKLEFRAMHGDVRIVKYNNIFYRSYENIVNDIFGNNINRLEHTLSKMFYSHEKLKRLIEKKICELRQECDKWKKELDLLNIEKLTNIANDDKIKQNAIRNLCGFNRSYNNINRNNIGIKRLYQSYGLMQRYYTNLIKNK